MDPGEWSYYDLKRRSKCLLTGEYTVQLPGQPNSFKPKDPLGGPPSGGGVPGPRDRPGRWTHRRQRLEGLQQQQHRVSRGL